MSHSIKELTLIQCRLTSIQELVLPNLEVLHLEDQLEYANKLSYYLSDDKYDKLSSIQGIEKFSNLKYLSLNGYEGMDLCSIELLTQLEKLKLHHCKNMISNISNSSIKELIIMNCSLQHIEKLNTEYVEVLTISDCVQQQHKLDIKGINKFKQLKQLHLNGYSLDLTHLKDLYLLKMFDVNDSGVFNLPALSSLLNLQYIYISYNTVKDINPILYLQQLNELEDIVQNFWNEYMLKMLSNLKQSVIPLTDQKIKYDNEMTQKYQNQIQNGVLKIQNDEYLKSIEFIQNFNIHQLELQNCSNMIHRLESKSIKELIVKECMLQSLNLLTLENIETLYIKEGNCDDQTILFQNMDRFLKLKKLDIHVGRSDFTHMENGVLKIYNDYELQILDFTKNLNIHTVELCCCKNIIQIVNDTITEVKIDGCELKSIDNFHLKNINTLILEEDIFHFEENNVEGFIQHKHKLQSLNTIVMFQNLQNLQINGYYNDFSPITNLKQLTILKLADCDLQQVDFLKPLFSLKYLNISQNPGIKLEQLAQLKQLTKLEMKYCKLIYVDFLIPLVNLKELDIQGNSIIYMYPVLELKHLDQLNGSYNQIVDINNIQTHPNFNLFIFDDQQQPTNNQIKIASKLKNINAPVKLFRQMQRKYKNTQEQMNTRKTELQQHVRQCLYNHIQFTNNVVQLFHNLHIIQNYQ
ncbi:Conserved_hypothetical protein [Hexamita inflata]|uniref:Leucine rich repeat protein n=1 Tax=Hexamita inflata TaxID=28002 RepID=A0ABP1HDY9_9EUKA